MDLETENRIASILLKEAAELRRQAQQEGALAYLRNPTARNRPNSRFLTATVRGIQQANRAVEVNEMWRVRQKEIELDDKIRDRSRNTDNPCKMEDRESSGSRSRRHDSDASCSSSKISCVDHHFNEDEGLRDEEIEKFLHSRVKRGRGSVGSRMDEAGPYLPPSSEATTVDDIKDVGHRRAVRGPKKPSSWRASESSDESSDEPKRKLLKGTSKRSKKKHSKRHSSKGKSRDKRKKEKR